MQQKDWTIKKNDSYNLHFHTFHFGTDNKQYAFPSKTRGPKGHISCTWVQCATFIDRLAILFFWSAPQKIYLVEDIEILFPVKFRWIPFREEVKNVSANQRPGWPSCFSDRPEKHNIGRGQWDLTSSNLNLWSKIFFNAKFIKLNPYELF